MTIQLNKVFAAGNLTRDPETRTSQGGTVVCKFGIAINEGFGDKQRAHFTDVTSFGKTAEFVEGRLNFEQWEKDGERRSKLSVIADRIQFGESKREAEGNRDARASPPSGPARDNETPQSGGDDGLPF